MRKNFISAVVAGICIALGGTVSLSLDNAVLGALMFTIGLFTIVGFGFNLFTGKVGYALDNPPSYIGFLGIVWLGNLAGTGLWALLVRFTRVYPALSEKVTASVETKLADNPVSLLLLGIACGLCMYIAVDSFKKQEGTLRCVFIILPVMVFILAKFEHCVADMFYFWLAGSFTPKTLAYLVVITIGNSLGGMLIPAAKRLMGEK